MTTILVPYHHDERLADDDIPVRADHIVHVPAGGVGDQWQRNAVVGRAAAAAVAPVVASGQVPVVFSGDCLVAGATVAGVQQAGVDPAVIWFDAHGDVHTLETTGSGYLGGLSLRVVTGAHRELYADLIGLRPVAPERAVLVDGRDLDPAEADYLAVSPTRRIPVSEVAPETVPAGPLVLHVDLDVIDAGEFPGFRFPADGGPSAEAVLSACRRVFATGRVVAFDVACPWWPAVGDQARSREQLVAAMRALLTA
ncbi:putative arginase family protein [Actinoplanes missouriensis 431]|uniref:Putative arginase family protein n=1 Tax=Actinoplanes missouriensis (strain ATCC 14538 / DSM 43046 / CBS 188.64 / JCM 3121 / NBRC 102363 / NCIMB 12654 / NRRL B-3342 / UNCC 431) TaxID=512565 RepID=I0H8C4_ACTM4|nr:arginase family protein [Actinoplanes missouriensis]BAL89261.1 putative arginase family protein [Actinoplanes missouriensis 431]